MLPPSSPFSLATLPLKFSLEGFAGILKEVPRTLPRGRIWANLINFGSPITIPGSFQRSITFQICSFFSLNYFETRVHPCLSSTFDQEVHPPAIVWRQINFLVTFESACVCLPGPAGFVCFLFFHCCAAKLETAAPPTVLKQPLTERKTVLAGRQSASN